MVKDLPHHPYIEQALSTPPTQKGYWHILTPPRWAEDNPGSIDCLHKTCSVWQIVHIINIWAWLRLNSPTTFYLNYYFRSMSINSRTRELFRALMTCLRNVFWTSLYQNLSIFNYKFIFPSMRVQFRITLYNCF